MENKVLSFKVYNEETYDQSRCRTPIAGIVGQDYHFDHILQMIRRLLGENEPKISSY